MQRAALKGKREVGKGMELKEFYKRRKAVPLFYEPALIYNALGDHVIMSCDRSRRLAYLLSRPEGRRLSGNRLIEMEGHPRRENEANRGGKSRIKNCLCLPR